MTKKWTNQGSYKDDVPQFLICQWKYWEVCPTRKIFYLKSYLLMFMYNLLFNCYKKNLICSMLFFRFRQTKKPLCFSYSAKLSLKLSIHLKVLFPKVFELLETIKENEKMLKIWGKW